MSERVVRHSIAGEIEMRNAKRIAIVDDHELVAIAVQGLLDGSARAARWSRRCRSAPSL